MSEPVLQPVRTIAPAALPIPLADVKAHLRVEDSASDDLIAALVEAVTAHLDGWGGILGRALVTQTWRQDFPAFASPLRLPLGPVQSITSVTYYDADNAQQTLASSVYELLADTCGPYVARQPGQTWPATYTRADAVSVTFVAGYGNPADVPAAIRQAMLLLVGAWYESREQSVIGVSTSELPASVGAAALLGPYRRIGV